MSVSCFKITIKHARLIVLLLCLLILGCAEQIKTKQNGIDLLKEGVVEVPDTTVHKTYLHYNHKTSQWLLNGEFYSGYIVSFYSNDTLKERTGVLNGKKQKKSTLWYSDGHFKEVANYHNGKLHGEKKIWSAETDHMLISHLNYYRGKPHGEQKQWYTTGELYKKMFMNMGKEDGIQQAFRKNGDLYANYEVKNGRIFGLKKSVLCYGLKDENVKK
ncbi:hypothetical protein GCM10009430_20200 [Aquimarina litoralis]|uniref:MORN repeat variant n=1 Tax=Aquimarina litoralis TaxID=584605 RepID=A0ABN1IS62_9FLAO